MTDTPRAAQDVEETAYIRVPALRLDIQIMPGSDNESGAPHWLIHDPLQHRYFKIDNGTRELLSIWQTGLTIDELALEASEQLGKLYEISQIENLLTFLRHNNLTVETDQGCWRDIERRGNLAHRPLIERLFHNYLFFKVPLFHPDRFLKAALPYVKALYTRLFVAIVILVGLAGLYLVSRQWDEFINTFNSFFSAQGAVFFMLALVAMKALHELGHALTAARYGCRVPTMGVAFILMMPLLYSDVTDAWRLPSQRQRLMISAAGIIVDLGLACIATFLWTFLPDGISRSAAFMIATAGWLLSLGFNLNPCMKFDGYYLLSDLIGVENLQSRSFALGRWKLRQIAVEPKLEPPEQLGSSLRSGLVIYAWVTWVYRLILFTTIALLVYYFCFKLLGIILFAAEIWFLIARPILNELREWGKITQNLSSPKRVMITATVIAALLVVFVVPWSSRVVLPGVLQAADLVQVFPPRAARVMRVEGKRHEYLAAGTVIARLESPEINSQIKQTLIKRDLAKLRFTRALVNQSDRENLLVLSHKLASLEAELEGFAKEKRELVIRAPISGMLLELDPNLHPGRWIGKTDRLALMATRERHVVKGYVGEEDLARLTTNSGGKFVPDDLMRAAVPVTLIRTAPASSPTVDILELASTNGGQVAVEINDQQKLVPIAAQYLVELHPLKGSNPPDQVVRGMVELNGTPESFAYKTWHQITKIFVRESGF